MALTWSDVTALIPSMSTVPLGAQTVILAFVTDFLSTDQHAWGADTSPLYKMGAVYLCAHIASQMPLADNAAGSAGGAVTSMSLGDAATSFAAPTFAVSDADLGMTAFGRAYLSLVDTLPCGVGFAE